MSRCAAWLPCPSPSSDLCTFTREGRVLRHANREARGMPSELTPEQAAARLETTDTLGMPLGPGQPPAFLRVLGERTDWTDLRVYGALLAVGTELFSRAGVHYLSGFFGPLERALRASGADIGFTPADFRRFGPLLERQAPRVMT